jgi:cytochrome c oxidase subunit 2
VNSLLRRMLFLPEQSSTFAPKADQLHFFIFTATMLVATAVGIFGLYFLVRYRRRALGAPTPEVVAPHWLEAIFIGVPLAFFLLWFRIGFADFVWTTTAPKNALDVYVAGKQWMWTFSYPDGPGDLQVLHVPSGRPVRLLITSRDVVHSFFVPDFRIKRDAVPGRYTEVWFEAPQPGRHQVLCAEYCGLDHSIMRAEVEVLGPAEFEAWRARQPLVARGGVGDLAVRGEAAAAEAGCLKCHSLDGSAHIGPSFQGLYGRDEVLTGGTRILVDEAYVTESMMEPTAKIVAGFAPVMPSFFGQLTPAQTASIVEFIKSLRSPRPTAAKPQEPLYGPVSNP